ncbi:hypothetical protein [Bacillus norwichensis]|uniref:Sin domain-containing protein n=1 Tax=Bacillus norwichensis TaxID=2762217 RepID=A0ABR8VFI1_9BACI|nr:hypothetical protein [Bacillus norwichensis]MBD8003480.1 hypothetical protein [Bacillus norwichensis]
MVDDKGGNQYLSYLDDEWVLLLHEAKQMKITKEEIFLFFKSKRIEKNEKIDC